MPKRKKHTKRVREKTPFDNFKANFEEKRWKHSKPIQKRKKRKGFEKKILLIISKDNFQGKGRKHSKPIQKRKKTKRVREKTPFDNFQGQFSRQRKEKQPKQYRIETKWKETKRVRKKKKPGGNSQGPRTSFEAKERKMKMPKGGKTGMKWKIMNRLNGDKKGMIIFNPKKWWSKMTKTWKKHDFQSLAGWDEHKFRIDVVGFGGFSWGNMWRNRWKTMFFKGANCP